MHVGNLVKPPYEKCQLVMNTQGRLGTKKANSVPMTPEKTFESSFVLLNGVGSSVVRDL